MDREQLTKARVAVIGGGWSDEREISLSSATECQRALTEAGFEAVDLLDLAARDFVSRLMGGSYDVAFVALHGRYGEDGSIQGLLDILHIPYTFSGVSASAAAAEKQIAKAVFREAGIPVPEGVDLPAGVELSEKCVDSLVERLGLGAVGLGGPDEGVEQRAGELVVGQPRKHRPPRCADGILRARGNNTPGRPAPRPGARGW